MTAPSPLFQVRQGAVPAATVMVTTIVGRTHGVWTAAVSPTTTIEVSQRTQDGAPVLAGSRFCQRLPWDRATERGSRLAQARSGAMNLQVFMRNERKNAGRNRGGILAIASILALLVASCTAGGTAAPSLSDASPSPSPSPSPNVGALFLDQLKALSTGSMTVKGTLTIANVPVSVEGRYDFSRGASYSTMTTSAAGTSETDETERWLGKEYERRNAGPWYPKEASSAASPTPSSSGSSDLGAYLKSLTTLTDKGVVTKDGQALHRLSPPTTIAPATLGFEGIGTTAIDFFARADGTPVMIEIALDLSQGATASPQPLSGTMLFTFVPNAKPAIVAPKPVFATLVSSDGFSFGYPADFEARSGETDCAGFDGPNLEWVGACTHPKDGETLTGRSAAVVRALKTEVKATIASNVERELGREPARVITYTYTAKNGFEGFGIYVIAFHGSTGLDLTWESPVGNEAADTQTFGYVIDSFKFTE
jgi:hypothetical protein